MEFEYTCLIELGKGKYRIVHKKVMSTEESPFTDDYNKFLKDEINNMLDDTEMMLYKMGIYKIVVGHPLEMVVPLFISLQQNGEQLKMEIINKKWYNKIRDII